MITTTTIIIVLKSTVIDLKVSFTKQSGTEILLHYYNQWTCRLTSSLQECMDDGQNSKDKGKVRMTSTALSITSIIGIFINSSEWLNGN